MDDETRKSVRAVEDAQRPYSQGEQARKPDTEHWPGEDIVTLAKEPPSLDEVSEKLKTQAKKSTPLEVTPRGAVLDRAKSLITGDRNRVYGDPAKNHTHIAALWNAYTNIRLTQPGFNGFDAEDVAMLQALLKVTRIAQRRGDAEDSFDSFVDFAGYGAIAGECRKRREDNNGKLNEDNENDA